MKSIGSVPNFTTPPLSPTRPQTLIVSTDLSEPSPVTLDRCGDVQTLATDKQRLQTKPELHQDRRTTVEATVPPEGLKDTLRGRQDRWLERDR